MVHAGTDPQVAAAQALHFYREDYDDGTQIETRVKSSSSSSQTARKPDENPQSGLIPQTTSADLTLYAFTSAPNADSSDNDGQFPVTEGLLGTGVYCWLDPSPVSTTGNNVYLIRFCPCVQSDTCPVFTGIKYSVEPDPTGSWAREGFAGAWQPSQLALVADPRGELCLRPEAITKWRRYRPDSWVGGKERSADVRRTAWLLTGGIPSTLSRLRCRASLINWASIAFALLSAFVGIVLLSFGSFGSALGAMAVSVVFWLAL